MKKAFAINSIRLGGITIAASTKDNPSVFDVDSDVFDRLAKLGAVRAPTKDEIAIAKVRAEAADGTSVVEKADAEPAETKAPASGAANDPRGTPRGASRSEDLGV